MSLKPRAAAPAPTDLLGLTGQLDAEERAIRSTVRTWVEDRITPYAGR
ncbi:MAG: hypothetical protein ACK5MR_11640 [Cumulibacter sp.]